MKPGRVVELAVVPYPGAWELLRDLRHKLESWGESEY